MRNYLMRWNFMRFIRLVLGVAILIQGINNAEWFFAIVGGLFSVLALLNVSTCGLAGNNACCTAVNAKEDQSIDNITYEEIK